MKRRKFLLLVILIFVVPPLSMIYALNAPPMFTEPYYYLPWHILIEPPAFCAIKFNDHQLPEAPQQMYDSTKKAVEEWKTKLMQHTNHEEGWDFSFQIISEEEYKISSLDDCSVVIRYERQPSSTIEDLILEGYAHSLFGTSEITIFYLDYNYDALFHKKDSSELFINKLSPNVEMVLKHEIGHALGLGHPLFENAYEFDENVPVSRSIMVTPEIYSDLPKNLVYEITDYDVNSIVNLYGERGVNEYEFGVILYFIFIGILVWFIVMIVFVVYFVKKILRKNKSNISQSRNIDTSVIEPTTTKTTLRDSNSIESISKKCPYCGRRLQNYDKPRSCNNCGNLV